MSYYYWSTTNDIPLMLELVNNDGSGVTGSFPLVSIKRYKYLNGTFLNNYYWNGISSFTASVTFLSMSELDPVNSPGMYTYCFSQSLVQEEVVYNVYFKHPYSPVGFTSELHYCETFVSGSGSENVIRLYESEPVPR